MRKRVFALTVIILILVLCIAGCTAGNSKYAVKPANFWAGLWHGLICVVTFIISLFSDSVHMYETNNIGAGYDLGFLLGAMIILSGGHKGVCTKKKTKSEKEMEWEEIGVRVEEKVRTGIQNWLDESDSKDEDWEEIGRQVEEKIKRELKKWAEK